MSIKTKITRNCCIGLMVLIIPWAQRTFAENLFFHGRLNEPPSCTVNDGNLIEISFGQKIEIQKLDGINYMQPINYRIGCDVTDLDWSMSLKVAGTQSSFDSAALQSNLAGLGIRILQDGEPIKLNQSIPIDPRNPPVINVVPVKQTDIELIPTAFEVTATLTVEYQ